MLVTARLQLITLILGNCNHKKETMLCLSVSGKIPIIEISYYNDFSIVYIIVTRRFFYMKTVKIKVIQNFMEITFYLKTYSKRTC